MNKTEMIKELRELTQAGMNDCKDAVEHCQGDLQKAIDYIKTKGLNIADGRSGRAASEGVVQIILDTNHGDEDKCAAMVEVNCQTDFVAKSHDFISFVATTSNTLLDAILDNKAFAADMVEEKRRQLVSTTKENIVVRRWWVEQAFAPNARVFCYVHPNLKLGVMLTLLAPDVMNAVRDPQFIELGENMAMQIAAMNPITVSSDRLLAEDVERQTNIFHTQLTELKKPQAAWPKILEGKFRKWHTEVCLMEQESVWLPKTSVKQIVENTGKALGGEIQVVNFVRCQVGEGVITKKDNLAEEVAKLTDQENGKMDVNVHYHADDATCDKNHK
jgi:elongation factor Ts